MQQNVQFHVTCFSVVVYCNLGNDCWCMPVCFLFEWMYKLSQRVQVFNKNVWNVSESYSNQRNYFGIYYWMFINLHSVKCNCESSSDII